MALISRKPYFIGAFLFHNKTVRSPYRRRLVYQEYIGNLQLKFASCQNIQNTTFVWKLFCFNNVEIVQHICAIMEYKSKSIHCTKTEQMLLAQVISGVKAIKRKREHRVWELRLKLEKELLQNTAALVPANNRENASIIWNKGMLTICSTFPRYNSPIALENLLNFHACYQQSLIQFPPYSAMPEMSSECELRESKCRDLKWRYSGMQDNIFRMTQNVPRDRFARDQNVLDISRYIIYNIQW